MYALLHNPNLKYESSIYYKNSEYVLLQPKIGYRYQFLRNRLYAKIAYAPYLRIYDWKIEDGFHQNIVLGLGFKLANDKD